MQEDKVYEQAIEYRNKYWKGRSPQIREAAEFGYITGYKACIESEEYKKLVIDAEHWNRVKNEPVRVVYAERQEEYQRMKESAEKWDKVQEILNGYSLEIKYPDGKTIQIIEQQKSNI